MKYLNLLYSYNFLMFPLNYHNHQLSYNYLYPNVSETSIDFVNLPNAVYLVKLNANGVSKDIKVIKK